MLLKIIKKSDNFIILSSKRGSKISIDKEDLNKFPVRTFKNPGNDLHGNFIEMDTDTFEGYLNAENNPIEDKYQHFKIKRFCFEDSPQTLILDNGLIITISDLLKNGGIYLTSDFIKIKDQNLKDLSLENEKKSDWKEIKKTQSHILKNNHGFTSAGLKHLVKEALKKHDINMRPTKKEDIPKLFEDVKKKFIMPMKKDRIVTITEEKKQKLLKQLKDA